MIWVMAGTDLSADARAVLHDVIAPMMHELVPGNMLGMGGSVPRWLNISTTKNGSIIVTSFDFLALARAMTAAIVHAGGAMVTLHDGDQPFLSLYNPSSGLYLSAGETRYLLVCAVQELAHRVEFRRWTSSIPGQVIDAALRETQAVRYAVLTPPTVGVLWSDGWELMADGPLGRRGDFIGFTSRLVAFSALPYAYEPPASRSADAADAVRAYVGEEGVFSSI